MSTIAAPSHFIDTPIPKPRKKARSNTTKSADWRHASQVLTDILDKNPDVEEFSIDLILRSIGTSSFGTSLMFFAIPEVIPIPIPGIVAVMVLPTAVISAQMAAGQEQIGLPNFLLNRTVPRKALALAIKVLLPLLKRAERVTKPRWRWASSPLATRLLGMFIFLLALSIAFPMPGFNMPQAVAIFIIGLGLVEKDGLIICAGVVLGLLSMLLLGAVVLGLSALVGFSVI
jgi:hypothetical protein